MVNHTRQVDIATLQLVQHVMVPASSVSLIINILLTTKRFNVCQIMSDVGGGSKKPDHES